MSMVLNSTNTNILVLENVSKRFGGIKAVDDISIGFQTNKITGLIGPNGAGKTTLFNLINGLIKTDSGKIYFKDSRIDHLKAFQRTLLGIGRLFQDVRVFNKLSCLDNILISFNNLIGEKIYETILRRKELISSEKEKILKAEELLEFVGLIDKRDVFAENLSFGQQKLLAIARLLAMNSEVFLLDEPTAGVHPQLINKILELIKSLPAKGKTIIFIEHNINVVLEISDWLYLLDDGKVVAFGLPYEVLEDKITREVYLGV